jgi:receptor kinase-like protein
MEGAITLLWLSLLCLCSDARVLPPPGSSSSNATADELALLSFKSMVSHSSEGLLAAWNTSSHFCSWPGVFCSRRHPERVVSLLINSFNISGGRISPFLGNLSFLRELDLGGNQLVGEIPAGLGRLIKLRSLNLSYNQLQGEIPTDIGQALKNLAYLNLGGNSL